MPATKAQGLHVHAGVAAGVPVDVPVAVIPWLLVTLGAEVRLPDTADGVADGVLAGVPDADGGSGEDI